MVSNPPANWPRVIPYLYYEDVAAAMDWLAKAFGFRETERIPGPGGSVVHGEMWLADGLIMVGSPGPDYRCPAKTGAVSAGLYVYVDDVNAHFAHARAAGAKILEELADQFYGDRRYMAEDPEGQRWAFGTHVRDVPPEEYRQQ